MTQVILSPEQVRQVATAEGAIEFVDRAGRHVAYVAAEFTPVEIAIAERRAGSSGPWFSTDEVLEHLQSLDGGR
jgi:hypothetical protein